MVINYEVRNVLSLYYLVISDPIVVEHLEKIESRVQEIKGGASDENSNALRIKLVVVGDGAVGYYLLI